MLWTLVIYSRVCAFLVSISRGYVYIPQDLWSINVHCVSSSLSTLFWLALYAVLCTLYRVRLGMYVINVAKLNSQGWVFTDVIIFFHFLIQICCRRVNIISVVVWSLSLCVTPVMEFAICNCDFQFDDVDWNYKYR